MGHVALRRQPFDANFVGTCPFHGGCAEGLISGPAISARFGKPLSQLEPDHPFRAVLAEYLGELCKIALLMLAPDRIVIGGGVMEDGTLYAPVSTALQSALGGYLDHPAIVAGSFVVPPGLGRRSGIMGALALAREAIDG
jgi:fructokinase